MNEKTDLSKEVLTLLNRAGWNSNLKINIIDIEKSLKKDGYTLNESIKYFLSNYGNITVKFPHKSKPNQYDSFHTNALQASESIYKERIEEYEEVLNVSLCPIGEVHNRHMVIMMDTNGRVFAAYDDIVSLKGNSGEDFLNRICLGENPIFKIQILH